MKRLIIGIVVMLLPLMMAFSFVRGSSGVSPKISSSVLYNFVLTYPLEEVDKVKEGFVEIEDIGFSKDNIFDPDWSGNMFEDLTEIGQMIADFFVAIWDYIYFMIKMSYLITILFVRTILWILSFPIFILRY